MEEVEIIDDYSFDLSKPHVSREQIIEILKMKPINPDLYRQSFVHNSLIEVIDKRIINNIPVQDYLKKSNERLEFIGDAVLNLVIASIIYKKYPDKDEGFMTRMRTKIVRGSKCSVFATKLGLHKHILTMNLVLNVPGKPHINTKVLEDCFEAFIGAIFEDLGFKYAEMFIKKVIEEHVDFKELLYDDNYKDILMRYTQHYNYELPIYECIEPIEGQRFTIKVLLKNEYETKEMGIGSGPSKKKAEQEAAKIACSNIDSSLKHIINRDQ